MRLITCNHQGREVLGAWIGGDALTVDLADIDRQDGWEVPQVWYDRPIYYLAGRTEIAAPEQAVHRPGYCKYVDFELEFAAVIGKRGKDVRREDAHRHIFGYTIYNDWSARDEQVRSMRGMLGPGKGKDFDHGITLGPCIVTADEIGDPYALEMAALVNGERWSTGNSADMHYKFEDCIADVTRSQTLFPGEAIGSGTVPGGCGLEHGHFLAAISSSSTWRASVACAMWWRRRGDYIPGNARREIGSRRHGRDRRFKLCELGPSV